MSMKAFVVEEFGDSSKLKYSDVPTPEPGEGEVRRFPLASCRRHCLISWFLPCLFLIKTCEKIIFFAFAVSKCISRTHIK